MNLKKGTIIIFALGIWACMGFPTSHPTNANGGYTAAPLDSSCNSCHSAQNENLSGDFTITGIPPFVFKHETYPLSISVSNPASDAVRAGFQMVALEADLANAGDLTESSGNMIRKISRGKRYLGHAPAINFDKSRIAKWTADWKIEENDEGTLTIYGVGMIGSGDQGNKGDKAIYKNWKTLLKDSTEAVFTSIKELQGIDCYNDTSAILKAKIYGGQGPYSILWNTGDTTQTIQSLSADTFMVTITDRNMHSYSDTFLLNQPSELIIDEIEIIPASGSSISDGAINISITGGVEPYFFQWSRNDTLLGNQENASLTAEPGPYIAIITDGNGCTLFSDTLVISFTSSISENFNDNKNVLLYPNPTSGKLYIPNNYKGTRYSIYSIHGQAVKSGIIKDQVLDLSELTPRIYFVYIFGNNDTYLVQKIVKQ